MEDINKKIEVEAEAETKEEITTPEVETSPIVTEEVKTPEAKPQNKIQAKKVEEYQKPQKPMARRQMSPLGFEEKVVQIKRISKTTKGGRSMRFSALVVVGNKQGQVGFGMGKSIEVPDAIKKAIKNANNNISRVKINKNGTVFHENIGRHGAGKILVKPAPKGTGIIAGGPVRAVVELAGYNDIYTKCQGSNTPINVIRATINGLVSQHTPKDIAKLRDKKLSEL